ncbi:hypothetical protein [uncultured Desulfovibrio sp.]|uniref:LPD3 domain-containing protein n=1 Tax=uncultured Desulfovibrio sp. TaxID=167968 RepID=UPI00260BB553|nr:hypothetical protein [uncultured Desulfovibrio sp.]
MSQLAPYETPQVRAALESAEASGVTAETAARSIGVARSLGLPSSVVVADLNYASREQEARKLESNPQLAQWSSASESNAAVAREDTDGLVAVFDAVANLGADVLHGITFGVPVAARKIGHSLTHGAADFNEGLAGAALLASENLFGERSLPAQWSRNALEWIERKRPPEVSVDSSVAQFSLDFVRSIPQQAGNIMAAFVNPAATMGMMGAQIAGRDYVDLRKKGVSPRRSGVSSLLDATTQAPMERLALERFLGIFKSTGFADTVKKVLGSSGTEFVTEYLQKAPELVSRLWGESEKHGSAPDEQIAWFARTLFNADTLLQAHNEALYEGGIGAVWGLLGGVGRVALSAEARRTRAEGFAAQQRDLHTVIEGSKTKQLSPEIMQSALDAAGLNHNASVPASAVLELYQNETDIITPLGWNLEDVQTAAALGQDIDVRLSHLHASLNQDQINAVSPFLREDADASTIQETAIEADRVRESANAAAEEMARFQAEENEMDVELERLRTEMKDALGSVPGIQTSLKADATQEESARGQAMTPEKAAEYALSLHAAFARRLSAYGVNPAEYLRKVNVRGLVNEAREKGGMSRAQQRAALLESPIADTVYGRLDRAAIREAYGQDTVNAIVARYGKGVFAKTRGAKAVDRRMLSNDSLANELVRHGLLPEGSSLDDMVNYLATGEGVDTGRALYQPADMKPSLPQRFAEMPDIEADSSQWFGEGKAIALPGKIETPEQRKALRGALKQWAKENFSRDTAVVNADTGWQVQVTPKGIEDSLSHGLDEPLARSVPFIPQIVESGIHVATTEKKAGLMSHIFANKIRLDGKDYAVGFVLREDRRGNRFYDHELTEIIDPDWLAPGRDTSEEALGHRTNRGDVMNILRDKLGVNDGSGQVLFQTASMKPSLPRRFAEMPGVEADSSQWFGEGKAIAADGQNTRKAVVDWARSAFPQGMTIRNADQNWAVQVTPNGIKSSLHHGYNDLLARSVPFIPQIVESGIHVDSIRKTAQLMSHIFANKIRLDGKAYVVGFVLREDINGNRFYDHELTEIIDPDWLKPGHPSGEGPSGEGSSGHRTNRGDVMNILRDRLGVNDGSGRVMFQPDSDPSSARGMVQFRADGSSVTSIFAGASDLSTPIHEGAHIFINDLIRVVAGGWRMAEQLFAREFTAVSNDASIDDSLRQRRQRALTQRWNKHKMGLWQAREDLAALVENANAQREAHGKAIGAHLPPVTLEEVVQGTATPEQIRTLQEVNAVSFEGYVREGRAPSSRLAAVFHKMRQWLAAIYRLAGIHGVKVTPDVRRVFDRMLANDEAIRKSAVGTALAGEGEFLSIVQDEEAELVIDESGQWKRKDRINYAPGVVTQETTPGDSGGARSQLVNATAVGIRKPAEAGNGYRKAALNRQSEHERLQELYERAEAHVTARMDKATLRDRNKRWKAYYDEGREMARGDVYYEIVAALTVKEGNPWSGISRAWLEQQYGKAAVADFMKTAQGRRLLNKNGGQTLDAVGVGDIVGNMDRAVAMGIADADGLYNYLYDNVVTRRRSLADDARAWADQRMADDDAHAEEAGNDPGEAYRAYLEEVEATVLRLAARQDAGWRTPEQQARWVEEQRTPLTQVRRQVKSILRGRPLKEILPNQFVGEVRKALQERNAALAAGNALDALAAVNRARTALESWIEANRIRKEQEDFERLAKRLSALKRDVVVPEAWTAIQDMLERFELAARRRAGDSPVTLGEAVAALCADSAEINGLPAIAEWLLNEKESGSYRNLTAEQLLDVSDVLKMLEHMGREALASNKASEAARVREMADAGNGNMSGLAPMSVAREGTLRRKWQDWMRSYFGGMLSSIQWQMRQADGFSNLGPEGRRGISEERIYGAIVDGETRREVRMRRLVERMEPVFRRLAESAKKWEAERGKALTGADGKPLPVPEIMRRGGKLNWTADRVIALAMNLGNEGNALRLREGYPDLTADTLAQLVGDDATRLVFSDWRGAGNEGLLSAQDWRDVQEVGNILQSQWKDIQATHERMFGFKPRGVEARPMTIRVKGESVSLNGWYYPAVYDPSLSPEVQKRQEQQDAIVRTEAVCAAPAAKRGFTRARANGGGGAPLLLETGVIMAHLNDVTRFIELAETVRFADRVTRSAQWRDAYIRAFGRQDYDAIRPNLKGIVLEERPATDAISKSADWLRERLVPWGLAFNFKTALLQSTAIFPAMNDLGAANVLRGVAAVARGRYALVRQIWEQSPYMKSRARNIDQDLRKTLRGVDARTRQKTLKLLGKEISWQDVVDAGMLPLVSVDMAASSAIWMAAYNREMAILANSRNVLPGIDPASEHHAAAVRAADMAVKAINPDFNPSSRSQFLRSRGAVRLLNIFSSAVVLFAQRRAYNAAARRQAIHAGGGGYRARLAAWGTYARYEAYDFALQGIAMGLVLSLAYGEDEPDKWAKNMGGAWLDAASMRVPVFNSMITGLITGDTWRGMSTVYQQPWDMAKRLRGAARTGEADKLTASMADVLSFLVKVPASRVWRNAERGYEQWEKGEGTPASVLMPRPNSY